MITFFIIIINTNYNQPIFHSTYSTRSLNQQQFKSGKQKKEEDTSSSSDSETTDSSSSDSDSEKNSKLSTKQKNINDLLRNYYKSPFYDPHDDEERLEGRRHPTNHENENEHEHEHEQCQECDHDHNIKEDCIFLFDLINSKKLLHNLAYQLKLMIFLHLPKI